jgi:hypothetical protein
MEEPQTISECIELTAGERRLLVEALCTEQTVTIQNNPEAFSSERWMLMESLKIKLRN